MKTSIIHDVIYLLRSKTVSFLKRSIICSIIPPKFSHKFGNTLHSYLNWNKIFLKIYLLGSIVTSFCKDKEKLIFVLFNLEAYGYAQYRSHSLLTSRTPSHTGFTMQNDLPELVWSLQLHANGRGSWSYHLCTARSVKVALNSVESFKTGQRCLKIPLRGAWRCGRNSIC